MDLKELLRWHIEHLGKRPSSPEEVVRGFINAPPPPGEELNHAQFRKLNQKRRLRHAELALLPPAASRRRPVTPKPAEKRASAPTSVPGTEVGTEVGAAKASPPEQPSKTLSRALLHTHGWGANHSLLLANIDGEAYASLSMLCSDVGKDVDNQMGRIRSHGFRAQKAKVEARDGRYREQWCIHVEDLEAFVVGLDQRGMTTDQEAKRAVYASCAQELRRAWQQHFRGADPLDALADNILDRVGDRLADRFLERYGISLANKLLGPPQTTYALPPAPLTRTATDSNGVKLCLANGGQKTEFRGRGRTIHEVRTRLSRTLPVGSKPPTNSDLEKLIHAHGMANPPWSYHNVKRGPVYDLDVEDELRRHFGPDTEALSRATEFVNGGGSTVDAVLDEMDP